MSLILAPAAQRDLLELTLDGLERFGPLQAKKYKTGLDRKLSLLEVQPKMGRRMPRQPYRDIRITTYLAHIIAYRDDDAGLYVIRILPARSNWSEDLGL